MNALSLLIILPQLEIPRLQLLENPFWIILTLNSEQSVSVLWAIATENILGDIGVVLVDVPVVEVARLDNNAIRLASSLNKIVHKKSYLSEGDGFINYPLGNTDNLVIVLDVAPLKVNSHNYTVKACQYF